jgi:tetratricopeptide (TPR) repeat protein
MNFCLKAKDLAISTQNTKRLSDALYFIAWRTWQLGDYSAVQTYAYKARRLARISADLHREARALYIEAMSWLQLGNYKQAVCNCKRARNLLGLSGMSGSNLDCHLMNTQAEVHKIKSEYVEAGRIYACILQETSADQEPYVFALALVNLAENSVSVDCPADEVQRNIEKARKIFQHKRLSREETMCEVTLAALYLREQKTHDAKTIFERCFTLSQGNNSETMFYCLEHLGDVTCWTAIPLMCWWTMILLVHSLKSKSKCCIHKALQFLGDVFLSEGDVDTAHSLFTLALEGFTQMDIHRSRAKCMLRLGDISKRRGHLLRAVEFWETARPLFERSSQVKEVDYIDQGLATVGEHVREQHRKRLDYLKNLTAPASLEDETESVYKREDLEAKLGDMNLVLI